MDKAEDIAEAGTHSQNAAFQDDVEALGVEAFLKHNIATNRGVLYPGNSRQEGNRPLSGQCIRQRIQTQLVIPNCEKSNSLGAAALEGGWVWPRKVADATYKECIHISTASVPFARAL